MENMVNLFLKQLSKNFQTNKKEINAFIKEFKQNDSAGKFDVETDKINCFYKNIADKINSGKRVFIYADYDVDGIFSCAMLIENLRALAKIELAKNPQNQENINKFVKNIRFKIPSRDDGYGINEKYLHAILDTNTADYVITCDNGTHKPMHNVIKDENYKDKMFVFDHHANGDFSQFDNVINPNIDGTIEISTGILLYRFFEKLAKNKKIELPELADLATFTAISDVASLDSNRDIVEKGLNIINNAYNNFVKLNSKIELLQEKAMQEYSSENNSFTQKGQRRIKRLQNIMKSQEELKKLAELKRPLYYYFFNYKQDEQITSKDLAFSAIPKINSLNRTGSDAGFFVAMLLCKEIGSQISTDEFKNAYEVLNILNNDRKKITSAATREALKIIKDNNLGLNPLIYINLNKIYIGIAGLVASKIHEQTGADVIVSGKSKTTDIVFSGRGNSVFNNLSILQNEFSLNPSFSFGGHLQALGGKIYDEELFNTQLQEAIDKKLLIQHANDKNEIIKENFKILSKPISIFELVELSKHLTEKTGSIPYSKNFVVPIIISKDMIQNYDTALAKAKSNDFVSLTLSFEKPQKDGNNEIETIKFITNSDDALELLEKSRNSANSLPIFYIELSNNCYDNFKDVFSGKISYKENMLSVDFIETEEIKKPSVKSAPSVKYQKL